MSTLCTLQSQKISVWKGGFKTWQVGKKQSRLPKSLCFRSSRYTTCCRAIGNLAVHREHYTNFHQGNRWLVCLVTLFFLPLTLASVVADSSKWQKSSWRRRMCRWASRNLHTQHNVWKLQIEHRFGSTEVLYEWHICQSNIISRGFTDYSTTWPSNPPADTVHCCRPVWFELFCGCSTVQ